MIFPLKTFAGLTSCLCAGIVGAAPIDAETPSYLAEILGQIGENVAVERFFTAANDETISVDGEPSAVSHAWIEAEHAMFDQFLRVDVLEETESRYDVVVHGPENSRAIRKGDWVLMSFYARNTPGVENPSAVFRGFIQRSEPTWQSLGDLSGTAGLDWNRHLAVGQAEEDLPAAALKLSLHLGFGPQSIDLAGFVALVLSGPVDVNSLPSSTISYAGMTPEAPWREKAEAMIAEHRKGELALRITDEAGQPVAGAAVEVELQVHDYEFGTFLSPLAVRDTQEAARYRHWVQANFNVATTPVYWAEWGWADPVRRQDYLDMAEWLQEIDMPARGHVLIYPGWQFATDELRALSDDPEAFSARIMEHLEEIVPLMNDRGVREYDVTNELRELTDFTDIVGMDGVVSWFDKVRELAPEAKLYLNENSILTDGGRNIAEQDHYFNVIKTLLDLGAPLDGIGMQGHTLGAVTPPEALWPILDRFSVFGLPIRITEYELSTRDEEGQGAYDRDFTTAVFAHPATIGLTRWGFFEPEMWRPPGALIRANGTYKPNGLAHRELLFDTWQTKESGVADADGAFACRAFFGSYRVRISHDGKTHEQTFDFSKPVTGSVSEPIDVVFPVVDSEPTS